jgi:hypothetical protein
MDEADRNPNLLPVFGGSGGGVSSDSVLPVVPVSCRTGACARPPPKLLSWYFCLINRSMAESASSASNGMAGFAF